MDGGSSSSEDTNEDPTIPGSELEEATITLTPKNDVAKFAFSELVEWLHSQTDDSENHQAQNHAKKFIWIANDQIRDREVETLLRRLDNGDLSSSSPISPSSIEPRTRRRTQLKVDIWTGCYHLQLSQKPQQPERGWTAGRLRLGQKMNDLVLCLHNNSLYRVRQSQAVLQVHPVGRISIRSPSDRAENYVGGEKIDGRTQVLNDTMMSVSFGALTYDVHYTRFAQGAQHRQLLQRYLTSVLGSPTSASILALTPTPSETSSVKVGQWVLTSGTIGAGSSGRVSAALNREGKLVALKRVVRGRNVSAVMQVQSKLSDITHLARSQQENRIIQLVEVISDDAEGDNDTADVWFVLEPAIPDTMLSVLSTRALSLDSSG